MFCLLRSTAKSIVCFTKLTVSEMIQFCFCKKPTEKQKVRTQIGYVTDKIENLLAECFFVYINCKSSAYNVNLKID